MTNGKPSNAVNPSALNVNANADANADAILLIGAGGMLGRAWRELLDARHIAYIAPPRAELDITHQDHVTRFITPVVRLVINCSGWTDVDAAEADEQGAIALNATGPGLLAARCEAVSAKLVHYSTDYVFDGQATSPYAADEPRSPLGAYGRSKAMGEVAIEAANPNPGPDPGNHLILRTSWLYAPWGKNFVRTIAKLGRIKDTLSVVNDQRGRPTSAQHLAAASLRLIEQNAAGIFHVTDEGECSWYDFACEIIRLDQSSCNVQPCSTDQFPRPAKRPAYSVLDLSKTTQALGTLPTWQHNLARVMHDLEPLS